MAKKAITKDDVKKEVDDLPESALERPGLVDPLGNIIEAHHEPNLIMILREHQKRIVVRASIRAGLFPMFPKQTILARQEIT